MGFADLQILNSSKIKIDHLMLNSDVISGNENNDDYDIKLQQILLYSVQIYSGKNLESSFNNVIGQKVGDMEYPIIYGSIKLENSNHENRKSSYIFCYQYYHIECIQNYIGKKINEKINELKVKCPIYHCNRILDLESVMLVIILFQ